MNLTATQPISGDTPGMLHLFNAFAIGEKGAPTVLYGGRGLSTTSPLKRFAPGKYLLTLVDIVKAALDVSVFTSGPSEASMRAKVVSTPKQMAKGQIAFVMLNVTDDIAEIPSGETLHVNVVVCNSSSLIINEQPAATPIAAPVTKQAA